MEFIHLVGLALLFNELSLFFLEKRRENLNRSIIEPYLIWEENPFSNRLMYHLPWVTVVLAMTEALSKGILTPEFHWAIALYGLGLTLRAWSMSSMGWVWSRSILLFKGWVDPQRGPYKFLKKPETLGRYLSIGSSLAFLSAFYSAILIVPLTIWVCHSVGRHKNEARKMFEAHS